MLPQRTLKYGWIGVTLGRDTDCVPSKSSSNNSDYVPSYARKLGGIIIIFGITAISWGELDNPHGLGFHTNDFRANL